MKKIEKINWLSRWAGSYTFLACSYYGPQYYSSLKKILGINFKHTLFLHNQGVVSFFVDDKEFHYFGTKLAEKSVKSIAYVKKMSNELKKNTDVILPLMKELQLRIPNLTEYKKFLFYFNRHLAYHNFNKKTVDFLDAKSLQKLLPYFQEARQYSEAVYSESEKCFRKIAKLISKESGLPDHFLTCLTKKEFETFLNNHKLPNKNTLAARYKNSVLYFENGKEVVLTGIEAKKAKSIINKQSQTKNKEIKGVSAYPGRAAAIARIILNPHQKHVFNQGDILVTGMTRPEFMTYIKKASAIVTDVGGILCHAAITAREFKIPCVVGTVNATKILKDGKSIIIDATKGIIIVK
jgi:phosphohistidine swiveling domain-containing protein